MTKRSASTPTSQGGLEYHLHTKRGDIAANCLLVGDPGRAEIIAEQFLQNAVRVGDGHRAFVIYTGEYKGFNVSVIPTHMGCPSTGIVLPEAVRSGARRFIRVGSSSTLQKEPNVGDSAICTGAVRLDGASPNWAPIQFPAVADYRVVHALVEAATKLGLPYHTGIGVTTDCFNEGQARPDLFNDGWIPPRLLEQHEELTKRGCLFYSMEEAALFVWCLTHSRSEYGELLAGAVDAIYGNRVTGAFAEMGVENAISIALEAFIILNIRHPMG